MEGRVFKRKLYEKMLKWKQERDGSTALLIKEAPWGIPQAVEGNKLYLMVMPGQIRKYIHPDLVDGESLKRIENLKEDDNQVVVCYELK